VGEKFLKRAGYDVNRVVSVGDHIGYSLTQASSNKADSIILVGHISKLSKVAAGIFHTHYKSGDARLEVIAAWAAAAGASQEVVEKILSLSLAEDALPILEENRLEAAYRLIAERVVHRINTLIQNRCKTGCALLSLSGRLLGFYPAHDYMESFIQGRLK
jgi:cobalt-precorrin-5B (C1)-methyltransferase